VEILRLHNCISDFQPVLGTALFGWGISKSEAFRILDEFQKAGGLLVDTASNYPINNNPVDQGLAVSWLGEWVSHNRNSSLHVTVKIGSTDNSGTQTVDLTHKGLTQQASLAEQILGPHLHTLSIHFDPRVSNLDEGIFETLGAVKEFHKAGYGIGFSGIMDPESYRDLAPELKSEWQIQVKKNSQTSAAFDRYKPFFPDASYFAYGINSGGMVKDVYSEASSVKLRGLSIDRNLVLEQRSKLENYSGSLPRPRSLVELTLEKTVSDKNLSGVILGPRTVLQLQEVCDFFRRLAETRGYARSSWDGP
jgi:hypothetical protein